MSAVELIAEIADWKLFLLVIFVYAICPQWVLRLLVMVYDKDDPRRHELLGELYAIDYIRRPFWVAQQFETALADGIWPKFQWSLTGRLIYRWRLGDGDQRHRDHPDTFWVPSPQDKAAIEVGDIVKLAFDQTWPGGYGERMWVRITKVGPKKLEGVLRNEPIFIPRLSWNDTIKFERKHIIDIDIDDEILQPAIAADERDEDAQRVCCAGCGEQCNEPDVVPEHEVVAPWRRGQSRDQHLHD